MWAHMGVSPNLRGHFCCPYVPLISEPFYQPSYVTTMPSASTTNSTQALSPLKKLKGHTQYVYSLAFFSDSDRAVSGSDDYSARIWDIPRAKGIGEPLLGHDDWVDCVAVSPDDAWVATGDDDGKLRIWNVSTKRLVGRPWVAHGNSAVTCIAWSPDGRHITSGSSGEASLKIWDGKLPGVLMRSVRSGNSQAGGWLCVAYSPDGSKLAAGGTFSGDGASISIWNTENAHPCGATITMCALCHGQQMGNTSRRDPRTVSFDSGRWKEGILQKNLLISRLNGPTRLHYPPVTTLLPLQAMERFICGILENVGAEPIPWTDQKHAGLFSRPMVITLRRTDTLAISLFGT